MNTVGQKFLIDKYIKEVYIYENTDKFLGLIDTGLDVCLIKQSTVIKQKLVIVQ